MTDVLAFHRPTALFRPGAGPARSCQIQTFARRQTICGPGLVAEWRINDHSVRLECHWRRDDGETSGQDAPRRSWAGFSTADGGAGLPHARRRAARAIGRAGRSQSEVS